MKGNMKILITVLLPTIIFSNHHYYQLETPNSNDKKYIITLEKKVEDLTQEISQLKIILDQLVKKIDDLQTSVNKIKTASPTADNKKNEKPTRKPADPNYAHNIPQGNSYFIGNPDAKVTITEFFDFQ